MSLNPSSPTTRFWYISLVACHRDPVTCEWRHTRQPITVQYDIWLVNGDPRKRAQNPLEYQFSFDKQVGHRPFDRGPWGGRNHRCCVSPGSVALLVPAS